MFCIIYGSEASMHADYIHNFSEVMHNMLALILFWW